MGLRRHLETRTNYVPPPPQKNIVSKFLKIMKCLCFTRKTFRGMVPKWVVRNVDVFFNFIVPSSKSYFLRNTLISSQIFHDYFVPSLRKILLRITIKETFQGNYNISYFRKTISQQVDRKFSSN